MAVMLLNFLREEGRSMNASSESASVRAISAAGLMFPIVDSPNVNEPCRDRRSRLQLESQDIFHAVEVRRFGDDPARGAQRTERERFPARGLVGEFESLPRPGERHCVIAHDITAAN